MAIWDKNEPGSNTTNTPPQASTAPAQPTQPSPPARTAPGKTGDMKESLIASGLTIEGKINGKGHVRVAGKFKGDIHVDGDLHIDSEAKVEGQVKASEVTVNGDLQGNIESAKHVDLKQGGTITGDLKAGSLTVAAGSRMRGNVDFGFGESK